MRWARYSLTPWRRVLDNLTVRSANPKISRLQWKSHYCVHKSTTPVTILSQTDPIYTVQRCFPKINLILSPVYVRERYLPSRVCKESSVRISKLIFFKYDSLLDVEQK